MSDCIFCSIIKGEIPCTKVYEDDKIFSFLDIVPVNKGHTLVIPKEHKETILDLSEDSFRGLMAAVQKIAKAVIKAVGAKGFNVHINNGEVAGQVVKHAHIHIIPRFDGDGLQLWKGGKYKGMEAEQIKKDIVNFL